MYTASQDSPAGVVEIDIELLLHGSDVEDAVGEERGKDNTHNYIQTQTEKQTQQSVTHVNYP